MENKRVIAFIIDFFITSIIQSFLIILFVMTNIISQQIDIPTISIRVLVITYISLLYMIIKDCIGLKSIGKRIMKLKIIDVETKQWASFYQRLFRNITWLLGPIEIIYYLFYKKRLGDLIAKTEIL